MIEGLIKWLFLTFGEEYCRRLFKLIPVFPKPVTYGIIGFGILMILTNFPYSYGFIEQNHTRDIIFLSLMGGGAIVAAVGVLLMMRNRVEQEYPSTETKSKSRK